MKPYNQNQWDMHKPKNNGENPMLKRKCDINIAQTIDLAHQMIQLAQKGYEQQKDPTCGILYGILLDSGYRLLDLAQKEKQAHVQKGWWDSSIDKEICK
jgi:hypothetical protein